jgi:hypothetical protein
MSYAMYWTGGWAVHVDTNEVLCLAVRTTVNDYCSDVLAVSLRFWLTVRWWRSSQMSCGRNKAESIHATKEPRQSEIQYKSLQARLFGPLWVVFETSTILPYYPPRHNSKSVPTVTDTRVVPISNQLIRAPKIIGMKKTGSRCS